MAALELRFDSYGHITAVDGDPPQICRIMFEGLTPPDMEVEVPAATLTKAGINVREHMGFLAVVSLDAHTPEDIKPERFKPLPGAG